MKMKYIIISIIILAAFLIFKIVMLNKYKCDKREIDQSLIFNENLTIDNKIEYSDNRIWIDDMSFINYFDNYIDVKEKSSYKIKYDEEGHIVSFYSTGSSSQYVNLLNDDSFKVWRDGANIELVNTDESTKKYLDAHGIKNDIDLLKYIKDNYYFKNSIFTNIETMRNNNLLNSFVSYTLIGYKNITLINGNIDGYIINTINNSIDIKQIHILKDGKQYVIVLGGSDITSNEFIKELLSSVTFGNMH